MNPIATAAAVFFVTVLSVSDGGEYCFQKYSDSHNACKHLIHRTDFQKNVDNCCSAHQGQGYAVRLRKSNHGMKWFECQPCSSRRFAGFSHDDKIDSGHTRIVNGLQGRMSTTIGRNHKKKIWWKMPISGKGDTKVEIWSEWSEWDPCRNDSSSNCEHGVRVQHRSRFCLTDNCSGEELQQRDCEPRQMCPVNGGWSRWTDWSKCSVSCGANGVRQRSRLCDSPPPEYGGRPCPGVDAETSPCSEYFDCPVDGGWSDWSRMDVCSAKPCSSEIGFRIHFRSCTAPSPKFGGQPCRGLSWKRETCYNNDFCTEPVDGRWCNWTEWTKCEMGYRQRERTCDCPSAINDGQTCHGESIQRMRCDQSNQSENTDDLECENEGSGDGNVTNCIAESTDDGSGMQNTATGI